MNTLFLLTIVLFICMIAVGRGKGFRSFLALFFNFIVVLMFVIFMTSPNMNVFIFTLLASLIISSISLFYINGIHLKTKLAFLSTVVTVVLLFFIIIFMTSRLNIQGFSNESAEDLSVYSIYVGIDFLQIQAAVIMMSTIGAIMDIAISMTSPMQEIYLQNENIKRKNLFAAGMSIGRDILGTTTNTLFFAFIGSYLALIIWFKDLSYSIDEIVNSKVFSAELVTIICAGLGVALSIPITASITTYFLLRKKE